MEIPNDPYEPKFPVGSTIKYDDGDDKFETTMVGFDSNDGEYLILADTSNSAFVGRVLRNESSGHSGPGRTIDWKYVGRRVTWISDRHLSLVQLPGPDGCACIRCSTFSPMATQNMVNTEKKTNGFGCFSCRTTAKWWFETNGWV